MNCRPPYAKEDLECGVPVQIEVPIKIDNLSKCVPMSFELDRREAEAELRAIQKFVFL